MKKIVILALSTLMLMSIMAGCRKNVGDETTKPSTQATTQGTQATTKPTQKPTESSRPTTPSTVPSTGAVTPSTGTPSTGGAGQGEKGGMMPRF